MEILILEQCNWNPLYSTVYEVLEFYLTQGVVFSTDFIQNKEKEGLVLKE